VEESRVSFTIDPTVECIGNWPVGHGFGDGGYPEGTQQITLVPPGQGPRLTWVIYSDEPAVIGGFEMGKKYELSLTVKEVPGA
jgi:hypothetical protein